MKRSELLVIIGITVLSAILFVSNGQLIWAAPAQTPHRQTVPPRPTDDEGDGPPAPPEEPTEEPTQPPVDPTPSHNDEDNNDNNSPDPQETPPADPATVANDEPPAPDKPQTETIAGSAEPVTDQETEAGATSGPNVSEDGVETVVDGTPRSVVEEPAMTPLVTQQNNPSQNEAFEKRVSEISAQAVAETSAQEVILPDRVGFPLPWLIALGAGLALIIVGVIIIKRA